MQGYLRLFLIKFSDGLEVNNLLAQIDRELISHIQLSPMSSSIIFLTKDNNLYLGREVRGFSDNFDKEFRLLDVDLKAYVKDNSVAEFDFELSSIKKQVEKGILFIDLLGEKIVTTLYKFGGELLKA